MPRNALLLLDNRHVMRAAVVRFEIELLDIICHNYVPLGAAAKPACMKRRKVLNTEKNEFPSRLVWSALASVCNISWSLSWKGQTQTLLSSNVCGALRFSKRRVWKALETLHSRLNWEWLTWGCGIPPPLQDFIMLRIWKAARTLDIYSTASIAVLSLSLFNCRPHGWGRENAVAREITSASPHL